MKDAMTSVEGYELRDLKKKLLFASKISFGTKDGYPTLIITPEDGLQIQTIVWANSTNKKDIA